jgi:hypothetical protein
MKIISASLGFVATILASLALSGNAQAQATRTWVSGVGDDVNPCSRTAPCKTFAGAISKTAVSGVINCLDPGGFGAVTITKSITIDCYWQPAAGILATGTYGVIVNAASTDKIVLRGLEIDGETSGLAGVRIISAASVQIDHCRIAGFNSGSAAGISVAVNSSTFELHVKDTHLLNNGVGATGGAIVVAPLGSVDTRVILSRVEMRDNVYGLDVNGAAGASGYVRVNGMDVVASGNAQNGVRVTGGGASASAFLDRSMISSNGSYGVLASGGNANVILGRSTLVDNGAGLGSSAGGVLYTYGTNQVNANGADGAFSAGMTEK